MARPSWMARRSSHPLGMPRPCRFPVREGVYARRYEARNRKGIRGPQDFHAGSDRQYGSLLGGQPVSDPLAYCLVAISMVAGIHVFCRAAYRMAENLPAWHYATLSCLILFIALLAVGELLPN